MPRQSKDPHSPPFRAGIGAMRIRSSGRTEAEQTHLGAATIVDIVALVAEMALNDVSLGSDRIEGFERGGGARGVVKRTHRLARERERHDLRIKLRNSPMRLFLILLAVLQTAALD